MTKFSDRMSDFVKGHTARAARPYNRAGIHWFLIDSSSIKMFKFGGFSLNLVYKLIMYGICTEPYMINYFYQARRVQDHITQFILIKCLGSGIM